MRTGRTRSQPMARLSACFGVFGRPGICCCLPKVATAGLHKGSMLEVETVPADGAPYGAPHYEVVPSEAVTTRCRRRAFVDVEDHQPASAFCGVGTRPAAGAGPPKNRLNTCASHRVRYASLSF